MSAEQKASNGTVKRPSSRRSSNISYKDASSGDDEDAKPLVKRRKTSVKAEEPGSDSDAPLAKPTRAASRNGTAPTNGVKRKPKSEPTNESDSDAPVRKKPAVARSRASSQNKVKAEDGSDSDAPLSTKRQPKSPATNGAAKVKQSKSAATTPTKATSKAAAKPSPKASTKPAAKKATTTAAATKKPPTAATATAKSAAAKTKKEKEAESSNTGSDDTEAETEDKFRWWEQPNLDGTKKWDTLEHNGVLFPPPYEPLPSNVHLVYDSRPVSMHPEAEEVAGFFGMMLNSAHNVENPTFQANFFADFKEILEKTGGAKYKDSGEPCPIEEFTKCDFTAIFNHYEDDRAMKRALSSAEKKQIKAARDEAEAPFTHCLWDGRKQRVGNFRVEPPSLFRGRGDHPKTGRVKKRVMPEQVTINIGKGAKIPDPPEGHRWKEVKHDNEGTWLAMWQENVNGNYKYVMLAADSDVKGQSDYKKFEKARELKSHIEKIRADYTKDLRSKVMADRQRATAVYLIDKLALRAGNEKQEDEADTVGCCSLKFEHITLKPPRKVVFDFLGKDSIRYYDEVEVEPQVFKNLQIFKKSPKGPGDEIFDRLTTSSLNKHLGTYMAGLTAKVFRTYNASWTMASVMRDMKNEGTIMEKIKDYNEANRKVAILCNHKRTVAASHGVAMEKMREKINGMRYQQWRLKQMMLNLEPKLKKQKGADFFKLPEELDSTWVQAHIEFLVEEQIQKITKKFERDNQKLQDEGEKKLPEKELKERLKAANELKSKLKAEAKKGKVEAEPRSSVERLETNIEKIEQRVTTAELQLQDRDDNKEVALNTSKLNYIDPRLTVVFCKKYGVPIEKLFAKTMRDKFTWAIQSVEEDWEF